MRKQLFVTATTSLLVLLFAYAALSKLRDYSEFQFQLSRSPFLSRFASMTAITLPVGELLVCAALLFQRTRLIGLFGGLFLMSLFTAYIYSMLHYSFYIPCSCGGILGSMDWTTHLYFNLCFTGLIILTILIHRPQTHPIR